MDDGVTSYLDPSAKPGRWDECMQMLSRPSELRVTKLAKSLEQAAALARHRGIVAIFSDLIDDVEGINRGLQQLQHRGHEVMLFHILDPCERHLSEGGRVRVMDMEGPGEVMTDVESVQKEYVRRIEQWCGELDDVCMHQGIKRLEMTTDTPPAAVLVDYLARRMT